MKIYFAGSISGGRKFLTSYKLIVNLLKSAGHNVLSEHVIKDNVLAFESNFTDEEIFKRDINWIKECDCMIAEVSNPSLGVGYEISFAISLNKPVLCLYKDGIFLTRMLTGNNSPNITISKYMNDTEMEINLITFIDSLSQSNKTFIKKNM